MDIIRARRVPFMARRNYVTEVRHLLVWGIFAGLIEGTVSAVVVSKTFNASNLLITVVQATPAFANLVSLVWGAMLVGRRKLPLLLAFGAACVVVTASVAATPETHLGGWIFAAQVAFSRMFMSGVVSARASLWKSNYPASHRGRICATLQLVRTIGSLPLILGAGLLFDANPLAYRWFYPAVAVIGAVALWVNRGTRVRGEQKRLAPRVADGRDAIADDALGEPFDLLTVVQPWHVVARMRRALREDPRFARYCTAQMCIGSANLMVMPINTIVLTKVLLLSYTMSNGLIDLVPRLIQLFMLPIWARLYDRVGVLRFRVANSSCWAASTLLCGVGAMLAAWHGSYDTAALLTYLAGRVADGLAQSGGSIAWNIGHLHFTEDERAELYMGIHVSLTGLRGLIAPFAGLLLYEWIGSGVFVVAFAFAIAGLHIFKQLAGEDARASRSNPEMIEDRARPGDRVRKPASLVRR